MSRLLSRVVSSEPKANATRRIPDFGCPLSPRPLPHSTEARLERNCLFTLLGLRALCFEALGAWGGGGRPRSGHRSTMLPLLLRVNSFIVVCVLVRVSGNAICLLGCFVAVVH